MCVITTGQFGQVSTMTLLSAHSISSWKCLNTCRLLQRFAEVASGCGLVLRCLLSTPPTTKQHRFFPESYTKQRSNARTHTKVVILSNALSSSRPTYLAGPPTCSSIPNDGTTH